MPVAKRIIPCLDVREGRVVQGVQFQGLRDVGDPVEKAKFYEREGADELVFLDINASAGGRRAMTGLLQLTAAAITIPLVAGGGINSIERMDELFAAGVDKVTVNTAALENPGLIRAGADRFGRKRIVAAIDARRTAVKATKKKTPPPAAGKAPHFEVCSHGGRRPTGRDAVAWAMELERLGAGEILLTSIDADGTQNGYDLELLAAVTGAISIPVIASGGAGALKHLAAALTAGGAAAVLAASILHDGLYSIAQIKTYLAGRGIAIRPAAGQHFTGE